MTYEIYFNALKGMWQIRVTTYFLLFFSRSEDIRVVSDTPKAGEPLVFQSFADADSHATLIGLDSHYARVDRRGALSSSIHSVGAHGTAA